MLPPIREDGILLNADAHEERIVLQAVSGQQPVFAVHFPNNLGYSVIAVAQCPEARGKEMSDDGIDVRIAQHKDSIIAEQRVGTVFSAGDQAEEVLKKLKLDPGHDDAKEIVARRGQPASKHDGPGTVRPAAYGFAYEKRRSWIRFEDIEVFFAGDIIGRSRQWLR